jgi:hypothetical protein
VGRSPRLSGTVTAAEALHLASRPSGAALVAFDRSFVRRAKRADASDAAESAHKKSS